MLRVGEGAQFSLASTRKRVNVNRNCYNKIADEVAVTSLITQGSGTSFSEPLPHCDICGYPTAKDLEILGIKRRIPLMCQCREDELKHQEKVDEEKTRRIRVNRFKTYSLMDRRFEESTFENWVHNPDKEEYYSLGKQYCEKWETMLSNNRGILLYGPAGTGKTYLGFAIANELCKQGKAVMAISVSKILTIIKDSFDRHGYMGETEVLNTIHEASLLILDDLGVEYKTGWAYEKLYAIIDARYRAGKPLIVTTNKSIEELRENLVVIDARTGELDSSERIFSRIVEMCAFHEVAGKSWRIQKGEQNRDALYKELGL